MIASVLCPTFTPITRNGVTLVGVLCRIRCRFGSTWPNSISECRRNHPCTQYDQVDTPIDARGVKRFDEVVRDEACVIWHSSTGAQQPHLEHRQRTVTAAQVDRGSDCDRRDVRRKQSRVTTNDRSAGDEKPDECEMRQGHEAGRYQLHVCQSRLSRSNSERARWTRNATTERSPTRPTFPPIRCGGAADPVSRCRATDASTEGPVDRRRRASRRARC